MRFIASVEQLKIYWNSLFGRPSKISNVDDNDVYRDPYLYDPYWEEHKGPIGETPLVPYRTLLKFHTDDAYWQGKVHDNCLYEMNQEVLEFHELTSAHKVGIVAGDVYDKASDTRLESLPEFFKRWLDKQLLVSAE